MTREEFAAKIHWHKIFWILGLVNVGAMLPQLVKILENKSAKGLSLAMVIIYLVIQIGFAGQGFFRRDRTLFTVMLLSAAVSVAVLVFALHYS